MEKAKAVSVFLPFLLLNTACRPLTPLNLVSVLVECSDTQRRGRQSKGALKQFGHVQARWTRWDVSRSTRGVGQHHHVSVL